MLAIFSKFFNFKHEELSRLVFLIIQSLFVGIFISYYYAYSTSLLVNAFAVEKFIHILPFGYLISGIFGFKISTLFAFLHKKIPFVKLIIGVLLIIMGVLISFLLAMNYKIVDIKILAFVGFVFMAPLTAMVRIIYWGMTMKLFDLRQGKRLFSLISTGEVIASIISFLSIPVLLRYFLDDSIILIGAVIGITLTTLFQLFIVKKFRPFFNNNSSVEVKRIENSPRKGILDVFRSNYFKSIFFLSMFSMIGLVLVEYSFLSDSKTSPILLEMGGVSVFFAFFFGLSKAVELLLKVFVAGKLLEKFGLLFGLAILPILLFIFSILAVILSFLNQTEDVALYFYILIAMNMLVLMAVKKSFEDPATKMLFQPLNSFEKISIQTFAEGKARELGVILTGLVLVSLNYLIDISPARLAIVLLVFVLICWIYFTKKVNVSYRSFISEKLESIKKPANDLFLIDNLFNRIRKKSKETFNNKLKNIIGKFLPNYSLEKGGFKGGDLTIITADNTLINKRKLEFINSLTDKNINENLNKVIDLIEDRNQDVVAFLIKKIDEKSYNAIINKYISDNQHITLTPRLGLFLSVIDYSGGYMHLLNSEISNDHTLDINQELALIRLINFIDPSKIEALNDLLNHLFTIKNSEIQEAVYNLILHSGIEINSEKKNSLKLRIESEVNHYTWLIASILDLSFDDEFSSIIRYLEEELYLRREKIMKLMAVLFGSEEMGKIKNVLYGECSDDASLGIEMLDIILDVEMKKIVLPIFESSDHIVTFRKLNLVFPQRRFNKLNRLKHIISISPLFANDWLRITCANVLMNLSRKIPDEIIANIFNKNLLVREASYRCIIENDPELFNYYLKNESSHFIQRIFDDNQLNKSVVLDLIDIVNKLKNVASLNSLPYNQLLKLARVFDRKIYNQFNITDKIDSSKVYFLFKGSIEIVKENKIHSNYNSPELIIIEEAFEQKEYVISPDENCNALLMDASLYWDIVSNYPVFFNNNIKEA